ncbi:MAG: SecDF P1 head subdomain-containing protein, partial [Marinirhabdus sp.]
MQNKGLITVFAILFGIVSLYQLSFTFISNKVEDSAKTYATAKYPATQPSERNLAENAYLDSVANAPVFLGIDYSTAKNKELNKGLDLKGGINVILQVSVQDILRGLANNSKDPAFNQALQQAVELQKNSQDTYLDSFYEAFENLPGENTLASPDIFFNKNLEDEINAAMTNAEVKNVLDKKIDESILSAFEVLRKRIDKFGVTQPNIQRLGNSGRILVELPGAKDVERVKGLLQSTAQLEFWDVYKFEEMQNFLLAADAKVKELTAPETTEVAQDTTDTQSNEIDDLLGGEDVEEEEEDAATANPILSKMVSPGFQGGGYLATFRLKDTATINGYLRMPQVRGLLTGGQRFSKFAWQKPSTAETTENGETQVSNLYALKGNRDNVAPLSGGVVVDAQQSYDNVGRVSVDMQMNGKGARIWEELTGNAYTNQSQIAIVLDDVVYSAPGVTSGPIAGGRSQITGDFSITEGQDLANVLRAGKLPASADIIQAEFVGPTLGQEAIDSGILSFAIALAFVLLWMIFYYGKAGIFADIALAVNILFIFGVLAGLGAVL